MKVFYWIVVVIITGALAGAGRFGPVLAVGFVVVAIMAYKGLKRTAPTVAPSPPQVVRPAAGLRPATRAASGPVHDPPAPRDPPVEPWLQATKHLEVAGEFHRMDNIAHLFSGTRTDSPTGVELQEPAMLVPDPGNPYDRNAVAVFVRGFHVGYLERGDAAQYHQPIAEVTRRRGGTVLVSSRQWARGRPGDMGARVTLHLPAPYGFLPANELPSGAFVLPAGATVQVTQEDQHMDVLRGLLERFGHEVPLAATLHCITVERPRSTVKVVEVRVDDQRIGVLSPVHSGNFEALVCYVADRARVPVARAVLRGNPVKAEVTLYMKKAQDLDPALLASLGPTE